MPTSNAIPQALIYIVPQKPQTPAAKHAIEAAISPSSSSLPSLRQPVKNLPKGGSASKHQLILAMPTTLSTPTASPPQKATSHVLLILGLSNDLSRSGGHQRYRRHCAGS